MLVLIKFFLIKGNKLFKGLHQELIFILFIPTEFYLKKCLKIYQQQIMVLNFISSFVKDNIYATQFHPEKANQMIKLLDNFLNIT